MYILYFVLCGKLKIIYFLNVFNVICEYISNKFL